MEQASISWSSVYFAHDTTEDLNYGDKIKLPSIALEQLLAKAGIQALPSPLTFQLCHPVTKKTIHCGVKEFSASTSDRVELPEWILHALELKQGDRVLIQLQMLPKGTWVQLKPISSNYREITDYRAALETHLRRYYNTLTQGQVLSCHYGANHYLFQVVQLKPEQAVAVNDTDLEVDIEGSVDLSQLPIVQPIYLNQTLSHNEIPKDTYQYWKMKLTSTNDLQLKLKVEAGDVGK
ncbi:ubiquitin fusion degradation protein UFD1-domain-containing protein [Sporodiniella umbellata]|nr:ubiquitin fusion degradation protein UFD1-domain-containing protein [Sporodiniella umbellata]